MDLIVLSLVVFSITLIVTKSKILGCKREFVEKRYESAKVGHQKPSKLHIFWHAMWTCPMCLGFWVSAIVSFVFPLCNWFVQCLVLFGLNWLWHCLENMLFSVGEFLESQEGEENER